MLTQIPSKYFFLTVDEPQVPKLDSFTSHSAKWRQNRELWLLYNSVPCRLQGVRDSNENLEVWTKGILQGKQNRVFEGK